MFDYTAPDTHTITLDQISAGVDIPFSAEFLRRATLHRRRDVVADQIIIRVAAQLYAERLPPQSYTVHTTDPRWATWWDHLKATYRTRWWARAAVRRWPPRTVDTTVRNVVNVRSMWVFPDAPLVRDMGRPMVWTNTNHDGTPR